MDVHVTEDKKIKKTPYKNPRPMTCRERRELMREIDYWYRAYLIAVERRERDKKDRFEKHWRIWDILFGALGITLCVYLWALLIISFYTWAQYGTFLW